MSLQIVLARDRAPRFNFSDLDGAKDFFDEHGFAIFSDALALQDLNDFSVLLKNILLAHLTKGGISFPDKKYYEDEAFFTQALAALECADRELVGSVYDTIYQSPPFFRLISARAIETSVRRFLDLGGQHALYGFTNRCLIAPPNDERRTYGWHQEVFYTVPQSRYIQSWAPLVFDTTVRTGTVELLPDSHRIGIAPQTWQEEPGRALQVIVANETVERYEPLAVEMTVGELLLFAGTMMHRSGMNSSNSVRFSLVGMYHDVNHPTFRAPRIKMEYRGKTPKQYFDELFGEGSS